MPPTVAIRGDGRGPIFSGVAMYGEEPVANVKEQYPKRPLQPEKHSRGRLCHTFAMDR